MAENSNPTTLAIPNQMEFIDEGPEDIEHVDKMEKPRNARKYYTKHMKLFPELYRSDVSIHPSYTALKNLPYHVVCRRRAAKTKRKITRQLNREIMHIAMAQNFAIGGVRIDRIFSIGFTPEASCVPDFSMKERRRINQILDGTFVMSNS